MRLSSLLVLTGALVLAACHRAPPEEPAEANNSAQAAPNAATPPPVAAAPANNAVERPAPPLNFTDDAQMRDDADASGLTARLPRTENDGEKAASNAATPH